MNKTTTTPRASNACKFGILGLILGLLLTFSAPQCAFSAEGDDQIGSPEYPDTITFLIKNIIPNPNPNGRDDVYQAVKMKMSGKWTTEITELPIPKANGLMKGQIILVHVGKETTYEPYSMEMSQIMVAELAKVSALPEGEKKDAAIAKMVAKIRAQRDKEEKVKTLTKK